MGPPMTGTPRLSAIPGLLVAACCMATTATLAAAQAPTRHVITADDGHPLAVWEKRGKSPRHTIVLLHGRTWSAIPDFDLQVPGHPVSLMDALAEHGFDVYALDARGYGGTARDSSGWLTPDRAAKDVITVVKWVAAHSGVAGKPALFGWSYGSVTAQLAAQRAPDDISALVLFGHFSFPPPPPEPAGPPPREPTTAKAAAEDFITPAATDSAVSANTCARRWPRIPCEPTGTTSANGMRSTPRPYMCRRSKLWGSATRSRRRVPAAKPHSSAGWRRQTASSWCCPAWTTRHFSKARARVSWRRS